MNQKPADAVYPPLLRDRTHRVPDPRRRRSTALCGLPRLNKPETSMHRLAAMFAVALAVIFALPLRAQAQPDKMQWFKEARFGMFVHWGIYSVPAGEWNGQKNYAE